MCLFDKIEDVLFEGLVDLSGTFVVPQAYSMDVSVQESKKGWWIMSQELTDLPISIRCWVTVNSREQVKPLLFGDGLLPQQLQHYGTHQVPFILELK